MLQCSKIWHLPPPPPSREEFAVEETKKRKTTWVSELRNTFKRSTLAQCGANYHSDESQQRWGTWRSRTLQSQTFALNRGLWYQWAGSCTAERYHYTLKWMPLSAKRSGSVFSVRAEWATRRAAVVSLSRRGWGPSVSLMPCFWSAIVQWAARGSAVCLRNPSRCPDKSAKNRQSKTIFHSST